MTNEELEWEIKRLEEQIEDLINSLRIKFLESEANKKPYEVKVPEDIENYYYVDEIGSVNLLLDSFVESDYDELYKRGLAFKTREEAEKFDKERILLFKLHKWAEEHNGGWTPNWEDNGVKWYVTYETGRNIFKINWCVCCRQFIKLPYFKSEELAREFIEEFGDEIKEVLC